MELAIDHRAFDEEIFILLRSTIVNYDIYSWSITTLQGLQIFKLFYSILLDPGHNFAQRVVPSRKLIEVKFIFDVFREKAL